MEAFAAGIPVMATDVGGTREIVDEQVGVFVKCWYNLYSARENLKLFYDFTREKKQKLRNNAFLKYQQDCDANKLTDELGIYLRSWFWINDFSRQRKPNEQDYQANSQIDCIELRFTEAISEMGRQAKGWF